MKNHRSSITCCLVLIISLFIGSSLSAQTLTTSNRTIDQAFDIAIRTIDKNTTPEGIILAGGAYGGEWTRDCAINSINALNLLRPQVAENSLWSVTNDRRSVGHQYWDKIIWVIAAWEHYMVTNDENYLRQIYQCARTTFAELEAQHYNAQYGLFMGPAAFQDGIAGYDEPVYQKGNESTYVLDHDADRIMCLSTNCIYYKAYDCIAAMAWKLGITGEIYNSKAKSLKKAIRKHFYNSKTNSLCYYIDQNGTKHQYTEALGVAFATLYELVSKKEAQKIIRNVYSSKYGVPVVYPSFPRYSESKPGRHNVMVWPHVNMFFAWACAYVDEIDRYYAEITNLAQLVKSSGGFYEIYDPATGKPSGGWQCGRLWDPLPDQTWCATGYVGQILYGVFGVKITPLGLRFRPLGMPNGKECTLRGIPFHGHTINLTVRGNGKGEAPKSVTINGEKGTNFVDYDGGVFINGRYKVINGDINIVIQL